MPIDTRPVAMLDSGVGGLSVLREVRRLLPSEDVLYFADQGHVPYGPRTVAEIRGFVEGIVQFFTQWDVKAVVIACNAASAASLKHARIVFPNLPFVGMEPAVKPAAQRTNRGVIGVITTQATYQGELFASVVDRFANGVTVLTQVCPEFVTFVEQGKLEGPEVERVAADYLRPLLDGHVDQMVLGCTHFPFLEPALRAVVGDGVEIVDPGPAVARQLGRIISGSANDPNHRGQVRYFTSGDPARFQLLASRLMAEPVAHGQVQGVQWRDDGIVLCES